MRSGDVLICSEEMLTLLQCSVDNDRTERCFARIDAVGETTIRVFVRNETVSYEH